jgi:CRP-like cAMP-binding protein
VTLDDDVARLARTHPFNLLPREAVQLIAFSCEKRRFRTGETLYHVGDAGDAGFFIHSGAVVLLKKDAPFDGARRVVAGALIGESALYAPVVRRHEARVVEDGLVARLPRDTFRRVLSEFPEAAEKVRLALAARTRRLVDGLEATRQKSFSAPPRTGPAP